jgi:hypothetical protein
MKLSIRITVLFLFVLSVTINCQEKPLQFGEEIKIEDLVSGKNKGEIINFINVNP